MDLRCELCGAFIKGKAYKALIDRAEMVVCSRCVKKASSVIEIININMSSSQLRPRSSRRRIRKEIVEDVVEDYFERIKEARENLGLTREVLATMVGEKVSTIRRLEEGTLQPSLTLARKLEKVLKIKLIEKYEEEYTPHEPSRSYEVTLGDIAEFKEGD